MTFPVNWLFLDDKLVRMDDKLMEKQIINGKMNLFYPLGSTLLNSISRSKTVGVGLQGGIGAAVYSGFNFMPFAEGAAKLPGFVAVCHPNQ